MGRKNRISSDLDLQEWAQQAIQKRIDTRASAVERLRQEAAEQESELQALAAALSTTVN